MILRLLCAQKGHCQSAASLPGPSGIPCTVETSIQWGVAQSLSSHTLASWVDLASVAGWGCMCYAHTVFSRFKTWSSWLGHPEDLWDSRAMHLFQSSFVRRIRPYLWVLIEFAHDWPQKGAIFGANCWFQGRWCHPCSDYSFSPKPFFNLAINAFKINNILPI